MSTALVSQVFNMGEVFPKTSMSISSSSKHDIRHQVGASSFGVPLSRRNSNPMPSPISPGIASSPASVAHIESCTIPIPSSHRRLDRSYSEPVDKISASNKANINLNRYKTELCRPFEESGSCKYADKCQFAHGYHELRSVVRHPKYKTELCRTFHTSGFCSYGHRCNFIHNASEERAKLAAQAISPSSNTSHSPIMQDIMRPKALDVLGFNYSSMGSTADSPSPPSSISGSPSGLHDYFDSDDPFSPSPVMPAPSTFTFSQDIPSFLGSPTFGKHRPLSQTYSAGHLRFGTGELSTDVATTTLLASPPSPVESLGSDLENLSISASPPLSLETLSDHEGSPSRLRLPVFNTLA